MTRNRGPKSAFFEPRVLIASVFCLAGAFVAFGGPSIYSDRFKAQAAKQTQISPEPSTLVPTASCTPDWSPAADLPSTGVGLVGVYFQANGKFYGMGGRSSDTAGNEFTHPFEYDPGSNTWTTKSATYPDNYVNNMACGVLSDAGTPYIYCVGGSQVAVNGTLDRVFRYDPVADVISAVAAPWPAGMGMVLPGGFTVFNNKLYIMGGFDTITGGGQGTNQIWEFSPPTSWVQKSSVLPVPLGYIPTTTIGSLIYTGGGSNITGGVLTDTTNSFKYDPVADSTSTIAPIPRATGETRALNFNGLMLIIGGGRTAPNPSNEVNIYNPATNTWTVGAPVSSFVTARRNLAADTDGSGHIWLVGGFAPTTATNTVEVFSPCPTRVLVTTVDDHNDGVCDAADCTLREAITAANANAGRIIAFVPGVTGTIQLGAALPSLSANMTIQGPGANLLAVRRNSGGSYRIFNISANNVTISGLTITNGNSPSNGGGISITGGLTIANCTISGHTTASSGGGIVSSRTLSIVNSTISGNSATGGFGGGIYNTGTAAITNSTISGNSASEPSLGIGSGGGILNGGGTMSITNSTISGNTAEFRGGGINSNSGTVRSRNTIIALNTAPSGGPDVFGTLTSENYNLIGNNSDATVTPAQFADQIGTTGSPIDPLLETLMDNGGPTLTRALLSGSTAINNGDPNAPARDQRGYLRQNPPDIGAFEFNAIVPTPTPSPTPTPTPTSTPTPTAIPTATATATPVTTLANISTRLRVETGDNVLIGGFIVTGTKAKKVIVRAIGPSLPVAGNLADPTLELFGPSGLIDSNDNWMDSPNKQAIIDSTIPPSNNLESAIVATLPANGTGYTAIVRGANSGTGIGVVEAYDLDRTADSKLANISTRGLVQTGDNVLIAGTIVLGSQSQKVLIRGIGPSLPFAGTLANPTLELRDQNGGLLEANDDWVNSPNKQAIIDSTIPPINDFESAIVRTLPPANYTAILRGVNDTTGIAVVEVYALQ